jgi:hypothetical protein
LRNRNFRDFHIDSCKPNVVMFSEPEWILSEIKKCLA